LDTAPLTNYLRDVADHARRVDQNVDAFRDLLTSILHANLAQVGVRQNEDMRRISAWVAIAAVPTMIAGIYGMNFEHMPELERVWGYPMALLLMAVICGVLYRAFRRSGWL
jgi:magnesium transporter